VGDDWARTNQLRAQKRGNGRTIWWKIIWPGLIITCIGLASILFLISCARVSVLELQTRNLRRHIDKQVSRQHQLRQQVAQLRDRARLREFAAKAGMVFEPADTDIVQLPALPEQRCSISPLTPQPDTLASRPGSTRPPPFSDDDTVVAEAF